GEIRLRAWYAGRSGPREVVEGCLNTKGWHRRIAVVPGHLANRGGEVRWRDKFWRLGGVLTVEPATALAPMTATMLLEG
ncbi:MAG TPA: hypothetical protein PLF78_10115, partial [Caulobacter sp.]|nr:hypothetical protein [Caulobacter sp.]